jgi:hypothetical protein
LLSEVFCVFDGDFIVISECLSDCE